MHNFMIVWTYLALLAAPVAAPSVAQGPVERQAIDPAAADRGRKIYAEYCINCHGARAKGTENGPDLIRSVTVLRDRMGTEIGPALKKLPNHKADLSALQIADLSHFLKQYIEQTVRNRNTTQPPNVLTGNPNAARDNFNRRGNAAMFHCPAGILAGTAGCRLPTTCR